MSSKVSIVVERNESGYVISFPESENQQFQDQSFEAIIAKLKETLTQELSSSIVSLQPTTGQSLLRLAQRFAADMTEDEINQLPADAAQNHDLIEFQPSETVKERVGDLIFREKTIALTPDEKEELDQYIALENMFRLTKARTHQHLNPA